MRSLPKDSADKVTILQPESFEMKSTQSIYITLNMEGNMALQHPCKCLETFLNVSNAQNVESMTTK